MRALSSTFAVALLFLKPRLRQPLLFVLITIIPLSFVVTFWVIGGERLSHHALYGMLVVFAVNPGLVALPQSAVTYRTLGLQEMYSSSPVGPTVYAIGQGLSPVLFAALPLSAVVAILVSWSALEPRAIPGVTAVLLATSFIGIMVGFALSLQVTNLYAISTAANLAGMLLTVLPPVYYPLEMVSAGWRWLPLLLPTTNAAALLRITGGISEGTTSALVLHSAILGAYALGCGALVFWKIRWRED
ncbi:MAG TPA: ABC transporter permease [Longimicrobiaceae bacterium]|nr:ABC transporter permease [Longimicrobiaceae bacterium]